MKRTLSLALSLSLVLGAFGPDAAAQVLSAGPAARGSVIAPAQGAIALPNFGALDLPGSLDLNLEAGGLDLELGLSLSPQIQAAQALSAEPALDAAAAPAARDEGKSVLEKTGARVSRAIARNDISAEASGEQSTAGARKIFDALRGARMAEETPARDIPFEVVASYRKAKDMDAPASTLRAFEKAYPGISELAAPPALSANLMAAQETTPQDEEKVDVKALAALGVTRTMSIASFVLTSIAYPFLVTGVFTGTGIPIGEAWGLYGALMAIGPMAAIATGPLNGVIADRFSARSAMVLNMGIRSVLSFYMPVMAMLGMLNFGTLLVGSIANGWMLSSVMIVESTYIKRLAGNKHVGTVNSLFWINYLFIQVVMGLILGLGSVIDTWNPMLPFTLSGIVHLLVLPILWKWMPSIAPPAKAKAKKAAGAFLRALKAHWFPALVLGASIALYMAMTPLILPAALAPLLGGLHPFLTGILPAWATGMIGSTIPIALALVYWVARSKSFKDLWTGEYTEKMDGVSDAASRTRTRRSMMLIALTALVMYPLQYYGFPQIAAALVGSSAKGLLMGQFLGALFFGNLIGTAANLNLPKFKLPLVGKEVDGGAFVRSLVMGAGAIWLAQEGFALGGVLGAALGLAAGTFLPWLAMKLASRIEFMGWVKAFGAGFGTILIPSAMWMMGLPAEVVKIGFLGSILLIGLVNGPSFISIKSYFERSLTKENNGKGIGVQGSFFNANISIGYGLLAVLAGLMGFPAVLIPLGIFFLAAGGLLFFTSKILPNFPGRFLKPKQEPKKE